jgi:hypothetical protein
VAAEHGGDHLGAGALPDDAPVARAELAGDDDIARPKLRSQCPGEAGDRDGVVRRGGEPRGGAPGAARSDAGALGGPAHEAGLGSHRRYQEQGVLRGSSRPAF